MNHLSIQLKPEVIHLKLGLLERLNHIDAREKLQVAGGTPATETISKVGVPDLSRA